ncbi:TetR/AcrR family transcriptional regulator [Caulobacter segnis]|jgi:AcrR family transcriptional regulator|uniref:TetR/AcrR family transcriptional regulator n=1 Tax=Caulobacter segnis TaxID=88688 RepID=UPI00240FA794|nr:TetR/AcrR family transcriptional regulator [Caulobacter segnis]MDG2519957.1 TetR/AcrR family transcriptional regulator [Caulobacter segnis]
MSYEPLTIEAESEAPPVKVNRRTIAKQRTREKVLEAARTLFIQRGYEGATIRDIAQAAGMSTGAVFANFADKSELFDAIIKGDLEELHEQMSAAASDAKGVEQVLLGMFGAGYSLYLKQLPMVQAVISASWTRDANNENEHRAALKPLLALVEAALKRGVADGEIAKTVDLGLLLDTVWDLYLVNYRRAVFDELGVEQLTARLSSQLSMLLRGARP